MSRREFIALLGGAVAWPLAARAQPPSRMRRIGVLMGVADDSEAQGRLAAFRQALERLGWSENVNVQFDYRWAPKGPEEARTFTKELIELKPDLIFVQSTPMTIAAKEGVAGSIPIVFVQVSDPVVAKLVETLAKPGGNLTGFTNFEPSMGGKWLELIKSVAPNITRVAYLFNPATSPAFFRQSVEIAAPILSLKTIAAEVRSPLDIDLAIQTFAGEPNGGLLVMPDVFATGTRQQIFAWAAQYRLPTLYTFRFYAVEGGLMSYGIDITEMFRQSASYVDRVLRGANPGDLPVQVPTKYELIINVKTAKALGLDVPPTLLARADEVIE
jgi:putative tryptophan/tyrosine transport system substrate-binding protein